MDINSGQTLLVFTAAPATESHDHLGLLKVIATQQLGVAAP